MNERMDGRMDNERLEKSMNAHTRNRRRHFTSALVFAASFVTADERIDETHRTPTVVYHLVC